MKKIIFLAFLFVGCNNNDNDINSLEETATKGVWTKIGDVPQAVKRYEAISFVINNFAYIGLGSNFLYDSVSNPPIYQGGFKKDIWKYNISQNSWTQLADFPGEARCGAVSFALNNKGYVGLGYVISNGNQITKKDFWEYDPLTDSWTQLADFPGASREGSVYYSYSNIGYLGLGDSKDQFFNDFWKFDPNTNSWTQLTSYPGSPRTRAVGFVINGNLYAGLGRGISGNGNCFDFWKYNISNDTWNQINSGRSSNDHNRNGITNVSGFSIGNYGYLIGGDQWGLLSDYNKDTSIYNSNSDTWTIEDDSKNGLIGRHKSMISFTYNNRVFMGLGNHEDKYPHSGRGDLGDSLYEYVH